MAVYYGESVAATADNPVLNEIREIVSEYPTDQYEYALKENPEWQVFYHLSEMRKAILNWYDFNPVSDLLEIGAGCGALTGLFCERCAHVSSVEYYPTRASILFERYQEKNNLEVYSGSMEECSFTHQFDYVTLIGSLEFQGKGTSDLQVYSEYLKKLKPLLKPNGKLLIAVENRFGIRNFCGGAEPFTNIPFEGINHYPHGTKAYAFDKQELTDILKEAGFQNLKFYYPLPDHKLPQVIYSDQYLPKDSVRGRVIPYYVDNSSLVAYENNLYGDLARNHVFEFFSNSFLVECSLTDEFCNVIYAAISIDRGQEDSFITAIHDNHTVTKKNIYADSKKAEIVYRNMMMLKEKGLNIVNHQYDNGILHMPYVDTPTLLEYMGGIVKSNQTEFMTLLDDLYHEILQSSDHVSQIQNRLSSRSEEIEDWGVILGNSFIDMIPLNCFYDRGKLLYFDQEFLRENYPAKYTLYRAIKYLYLTFPYIENYVPIKDLKAKYVFSEDIWEACEQEESLFVAANRSYDMNKQFLNWTSVDMEQIYNNVRK